MKFFLFVHFSMALSAMFIGLKSEIIIYNGVTKKDILKKILCVIGLASIWEMVLIWLCLDELRQSNPITWYKKFKALPWEIK